MAAGFLKASLQVIQRTSLKPLINLKSPKTRQADIQKEHRSCVCVFHRCCGSEGGHRFISNPRAGLAWTIYGCAFLRLPIQDRSHIAQVLGT
jgi:hypothetical protein